MVLGLSQGVSMYLEHGMASVGLAYSGSLNTLSLPYSVLWPLLIKVRASWSFSLICAQQCFQSEYGKTEVFIGPLF